MQWNFFYADPRVRPEIKLFSQAKHKLFFLLRMLLQTITGVIKSERFKVAYRKIQYKISRLLSDDFQLR